MPIPVSAQNINAIRDLRNEIRAARKAGDERAEARLQAALDARLRIEERREVRAEQARRIREQAEQQRSSRPWSSTSTGETRSAPPAGSWKDRYTSAQFEEFFGYSKPAAAGVGGDADEPAPPAPGSDIPF